MKTYDVKLTRGEILKTMTSIEKQLIFWKTNYPSKDKFIREIEEDWIKTLDGVYKKIEVVWNQILPWDE